MRYVESKIQQEDIESSYRFFISEGFKILSKNTAGGNERAILEMNFMDFLSKKNQPPDTRTAEEIIENIKSRLNVLGGDQS